MLYWQTAVQDAIRKTECIVENDVVDDSNSVVRHL